MTQGSGKRAGSRRGSKKRSGFRVDVALLAVLVTVATVAWGLLVWFAVDFGTRGRSGESGAWWLMAATGVGAVACLFVALMLVARLGRALGLTSAAPRSHAAAAVAIPEASAEPGRRAAGHVPPGNPYAPTEPGDTAERPTVIPHGRHQA